MRPLELKAFVTLAFTFLLSADVFAIEIPKLIILSNSENSESSVANGFEAIKKENDSFITVESLLEKTAAINIKKSGGVGSNTSISLRGFDGSNLNIYINGVLVSNGQDGFDLSLIPTSIIEKIEIYKSGAGVEFNDSNLGGAINIITSGKSGKSTYLLGAGSFSQRKAAISSHGLSLSYYESLNDFEYTNDNQTALNPNDDRVEKRNHAYVEQFNLNFQKKIKAQQIQVLHTLSSREIPDLKNSSNIDTLLDERFNQLSYEYDLDEFFTQQGLTKIKATLLSHEQDYKDQNSSIGLGAQDNKLERSRISAGAYHQHFFESHELSSSLNLAQEKIENLNQLTNNKDELTRESVELSSELKWNRSLIHSTQIGFRSFQSQDDNQTQSKNRSYFSYWAKESHKTKKYQLSAKYSALEKLPSLMQLYADQGLVRGNPNLENEKSQNLYFDGLYNFKNSSIELGLFFNALEDAIVYVYDSSGIGVAQNVAEALNYGVEASYRVQLAKDLNFQTSALVQNPLNKSDVASFRDKQLPGIFKRSYTASLDYKLKKNKFELEFRSNQQMFYDTSNLLQAQDQDLLNFSYSYHYKDSLSFKLAVDNILDKNYEEFNGYPTAGINYFLSVFGRF